MTTASLFSNRKGTFRNSFLKERQRPFPEKEWLFTHQSQLEGYFVNRVDYHRRCATHWNPLLLAQVIKQELRRPRLWVLIMVRLAPVKTIFQQWHYYRNSFWWNLCQLSTYWAAKLRDLAHGHHIVIFSLMFSQLSYSDSPRENPVQMHIFPRMPL